MIPSAFICIECNRKFDAFDETDMQDWNYGHDCEETQ